MEWIWIRHGMTKGNEEKRYVGGRTDEELCAAGRRRLLERKAGNGYPEASLVYVSPMKRCLETAQILYPEAEKQIVPGFRECDFGLFENKNHEQLSGLPVYQRWLDEKGMARFPEGEDPADFRRRSVQALEEIVKTGRLAERTAFVVHGGTIMSVFSALEEKQRGFYDYHVDNGEGYLCRAETDGGKIVLRACRKIGGDDAGAY